ncbi:MAG TPA: TetR family transcriptional regulator C-terminal domain-containing protein [Solirubrobacterales bacterium]|nr:TetR family transcriptional regulator C-terminal domain-containing protein [Solirubrobacterales bacterium]
MPAEINVTERLQAIAVATLQLAQEEGPGGVTVRAVAKRLGGSTTLVTKYIPSRTALLANAFEHISAHWQNDLGATLEDQEGMDRLRSLALWSLNTGEFEDAIRRLWIAALAGSPPGPEGGETSRTEAHDEYEFIRETVAGADQEAWLADALFLAFRGFYVSSVEDPENWPPERAAEAITRLLDIVEASRQ